MPKKQPEKDKPKVHNELNGLNISINEFGEIVSNVEIEKLNSFLNRHVDDKKLSEEEE